MDPSAPDDADPTALKAVLETVRFDGEIVFSQFLSSPWAISIPASAGPFLHIAMTGSQYIQARGRSTAIEMACGDIALLAHHEQGGIIADRPMPALADNALRQHCGELPPTRPETHTHHLVCGRLVSPSATTHPVFDNLPDVLHLPTDKQGALLQSLRQLLGESLARGDLPAISAGRLIELVFIEVLTTLWQAAEVPAITHSTDSRLRRLLGAIDKAPGDAWTLDSAADLAGVSTATVARLFRQQLGMGFKHYLTVSRVQRAKELLRNGSLSLDVIAERSGFSSRESLSRAYRRITGVSPSRDRR